MRTTVTLDADVAAAVERLRHELGVGPSRVINDLIRAGLTAERPGKRYEHKSYPMGMKIDVTNVAEAIELAEGPDWR